MTSFLKKQVLFVCIISASSQLLAMEGTPPAAKVQKLGESTTVSTKLPVTQPQFFVTPPTQAATKKRIRRRRNKSTATECSQPTTQPEEAPTEPTTKLRKIDTSEQSDAISTVFAQPALLANIAQYLMLSDYGRFAAISKACKQAVEENFGVKEAVIANKLYRFISSPIRYILYKAQGSESSESIVIHRTSCKTAQLLKFLLEKGSLLDEPLFDRMMINSYSKGITVSQALAKYLSPDELMALKPVIHLKITNNQITEERLVEKVQTYANKFPDNLIMLNFLKLPNFAHDRNIDESLINKLAGFHIVSFRCQGQRFPHGLACLSVLHELRELVIIQCPIAEEDKEKISIPDELCQGLPLLATLEINTSGITSVPSTIENLKHLRILNLFGNKITEFPSTLHNLHLFVLDLTQIEPIQSEKLSAVLPATSHLQELSISYTGRKDPLAECDLTQLRVLILNNNTGVQRLHCEQLKKLKTLGVTNAVFPSCISQLSSLEDIQTPPRSRMSYETLQCVAHHTINCRQLRIDGRNDIERIKQVAQVWQFIQANHALINEKLAMFTDDPSDFYPQNIDIINLLRKLIINGNKLETLLMHSPTCIRCQNFIETTLSTYGPFTTGIQEACTVSDLVRPDDQNFKSFIKTIASRMCNRVHIYSFVKDGKIISNQFLLDQLKSIATAITQIIEVIEKGNVVAYEQFNNCLRQLKLYYEDGESLLADLFFHHAIIHNNITNAAIMLQHHANVNAVLIPSFDTPLHTAIRNRMNTDDVNMKEQINHVIDFLLKNGASCDQPNSEGKTPLDLISDSSFLKTIDEWRTK